MSGTGAYEGAAGATALILERLGQLGLCSLDLAIGGRDLRLGLRNSRRFRLCRILTALGGGQGFHLGRQLLLQGRDLLLERGNSRRIGTARATRTTCATSSASTT